MRKLKVYGWQGPRREAGELYGRTREIVAASSKAEVARLAGERGPHALFNLCETANEREVAMTMAEPRVIFWAELDDSYRADAQWHRVEPEPPLGPLDAKAEAAAQADTSLLPPLMQINYDSAEALGISRETMAEIARDLVPRLMKSLPPTVTSPPYRLPHSRMGLTEEQGKRYGVHVVHAPASPPWTIEQTATDRETFEHVRAMGCAAAVPPGAPVLSHACQENQHEMCSTEAFDGYSQLVPCGCSCGHSPTADPPRPTGSMPTAHCGRSLADGGYSVGPLCDEPGDYVVVAIDEYGQDVVGLSCLEHMPQEVQDATLVYPTHPVQVSLTCIDQSCWQLGRENWIRQRRTAKHREKGARRA